MIDPAPSDRAPLRIVRLTIEELFGPGSGTIDILFKLDERVTVLHGRNGSGKTITLRLLAALRERQLEVLAGYPFKKLRIEASDGSGLEIERVMEAPPRRPGLDLRLSRPGQETVELPLATYQFVLFSTANESATTAPFVSFLGSLPTIKFIEADRLFVRVAEDASRDDVAEPELMVERLSQDIRKLITAADREYRRISTTLDSSLPKRLFGPAGQVPSRDELTARAKALREHTDRLFLLGLLREQLEMIDEATLTEDEQKAFFVILQDREQKLQPFAAIASKAQLLLGMLNRKLAPKTVRFDAEAGYQVYTANGVELPLRCLSSGEQHELVLLHELLFDIEPGSMILIDEPELSLHVTWQEDVLSDLIQIAKLAELDIVLATHSPYIVGKREDLMVRLGDPV